MMAVKLLVPVWKPCNCPNHCPPGPYKTEALERSGDEAAARAGSKSDGGLVGCLARDGETSQVGLDKLLADIRRVLIAKNLQKRRLRP